MGTDQGNLDIFLFSASSWLILKLRAEEPKYYLEK